MPIRKISFRLCLVLFRHLYMLNALISVNDLLHLVMKCINDMNGFQHHIYAGKIKLQAWIYNTKAKVMEWKWCQ